MEYNALPLEGSGLRAASSVAVRRADDQRRCVAVHCPFCGETETKVIDSRLVTEGDQVRRRRECQNPKCGERFTTFEIAELLLPQVVKADGTRQRFDESKLESGMLRALEKRPVSVETIEAALNRIKRSLQVMGEREVESRLVGELVMAELHKMDDVAYVRFASVYRRFQDVNEFREEIERLGRAADDERDEHG